MRDLSKSRVLERADRFIDEAYRFARRLPSSERFGLKPQIERASVSVALNVSEGLGRGTDGDLERMLRIAAGSAAEVETLTRLAVRLHGMDPAVAVLLVEETKVIRRMLNRFVATVNAARRGGPSSPSPIANRQSPEG
jgi:four helix bundle protein